MAERQRRSGGKRGAERRRDRARRREGGGPREDRLPFERANWILFAVALGVIALGYVALAMGSITLAPFLLVLGYCVLVPLAIMFRGHGRSRSPEESGE